MLAEEADDGIADAGEAEVGGIDLADGNPQGLGGIVGSADDGLQRLRVAMYGNQEIHVERVYAHAAVHVNVGRREEVLDVVNIQPCLFFDFASHALLYRLTHVDEAARQVERALGRLLGTAHHQHLVVVVDDEGGGSRARISVVGEAAGGTLLALEVVLLEAGTAAYRTVRKFLQWVHDARGLPVVRTEGEEGQPAGIGQIA